MRVLSEDNTQKDLNITINYPDEVVKMEYEYLPAIYLDNVPEDYNLGPSDVYVDNVFEKTVNFNSANENNELAIDVNKLSYGNHTLTVNLPGSANYNPKNVTHNFRVVQSMIIIPDEVIMGLNDYVRVVANIDATGNLIVKVNGTQFKNVALVSDGHRKYANVDISSLNLGTYEIEAIYTGDSNFDRISQKKTVNVTYTFTAYAYYSIYGSETGRIDIYDLPKDIEYLPVVTINGINFNVTKSQTGECYEVNTRYAPAGVNNIVITYPGDKKYPKRSIYLNNTVNCVPLYKTFDGGYDENVVYIRAPEDAQGNLTVLVDGVFFKSIRVSGGEAKIDLDLPYKWYTIEAFYTGQDYPALNQTFFLTLVPKVVYQNTMTYGEKQTIYFEMTPNSTGNFTISYNNIQNAPIEIIDGKGNFTIVATDLYTWSDANPNGFYLNFNYVDDSGFSHSFMKRINVKPRALKLSAKDVSGLYGNVITYSVKVWGGTGKLVEYGLLDIKIGSKVYSVRTDGNGVLKIKIGSNSIYMCYNSKHNGYDETKIKLSPGTYKITANYLGTKITTKLVVKPAKKVLVLKKVTVKKSAKKLVLQAKLKINDKLANGKKITFKFKGKKYTAKTNKKGIAKVTIKKNVLKKLKVGKKVKYQASFEKVVVKKTAKVKK